MLSDFEKAVLKNNQIPLEDVESVDSEYVVTMKDGTQHRIVECYSRVMGYLRPKSEYNIGKRQEHNDRRLFDNDKCSDSVSE